MEQNEIKIGDLVKIVGVRLDQYGVLNDILKRRVDKEGGISYIAMAKNEKLPVKFGVITRILTPYQYRKNYTIYEFLCGGNLYFTSTVKYLKKINSTENETTQF